MSDNEFIDALRKIAEREAKGASPRASALLWRVIDQASHELTGTPAPELPHGRYMTMCKTCGCQTEHRETTGQCVVCHRADAKKRMQKKRKSNKQSNKQCYNRAMQTG